MFVLKKNLVKNHLNMFIFSETLRKTTASTLDSTSGGSGDNRKHNLLTKLEKQFEFNDLKKSFKVEFCESSIVTDESSKIQPIVQWLETYS